LKRAINRLPHAGLVRIVRPDPDGVGAAVAPETRSFYDAAERLLSESDPSASTTT
jgi:hypothetical protein